MGPNHQIVISPHALMIILALALWESVWRLIAFWKAARHNQMAWFIVMAILNTAGILEIIYLAFFQKVDREHVAKSLKQTQSVN